MIPVMYLGIGFLAGALVGWLLARHRGVTSGFAALGLTSGLFLGLSSTPVLGAAIAAAFTLVGVLIPVYLPGPARQPEERGPAPPPIRDWLFPFATALAVGAIVGIGIRVNDGLNFASPNLRHHYHKLGLNESEIDLVMQQNVRQLTHALPNLTEQYKSLGFSDEQIKEMMYRHSQTVVLDLQALRSPSDGVIALGARSDVREPYLQFAGDKIDYAEFWQDLVRPDDSSEHNLNRVKAGAGPTLARRIAELEARRLPAKAILAILKSELKVP